MIIPFDSIAPETLQNLIKEFVLREGTDYGEFEAALDEKIAHVHNQLATGEAVIVYSELHESVNIMPALQFHSNANFDDLTQ